MVFDNPKRLRSIEKQTLFLIFGHSQKCWKIDAKRDPRSHGFGYKIDHWALKGRFIACFGLILDESKKRRFSEGRKIKKIDPWGTKGRKGTKGWSPSGGLRRRTRPQGGGGGREIPPLGRGRGIDSRVPLNHLSPEGWWDLYIYIYISIYIYIYFLFEDIWIYAHLCLYILFTYLCSYIFPYHTYIYIYI